MGSNPLFSSVVSINIRWPIVRISPVFLDILAMFALAIGQAEQPFLEDGVLLISQGQGNAQSLFVVAGATLTCNTSGYGT